MFPGGELWITDEKARDLSDVRQTTTDRPKGCITFAPTLIRLRRSAVNDHRSASRSRGPDISRYFDVFGPVSFLDNTYIIFSCTLGIVHHAFANCKVLVP